MNISDMYDYLVRSRRDLWAALENVPDEVLSRDVLHGERFRCVKDLSTRQFPAGLEKVRLTRENWTRLPMSWPS